MGAVEDKIYRRFSALIDISSTPLASLISVVVFDLVPAILFSFD